MVYQNAGMNGRPYTKWKNATKEQRGPLWAEGCAQCKIPFAEDEKFLVIDIEDGFNDKIYGYHKGCFGIAVHSLNLEKDV